MTSGRQFGTPSAAMPSIVPIIPIRRSDAFDDGAFVYELKYDGFRALADTLNGRRLLSKNTNRMRRFERRCFPDSESRKHRL